MSTTTSQRSATYLSQSTCQSGNCLLWAALPHVACSPVVKPDGPLAQPSNTLSVKSLFSMLIPCSVPAFFHLQADDEVANKSTFDSIHDTEAYVVSAIFFFLVFRIRCLLGRDVAPSPRATIGGEGVAQAAGKCYRTSLLAETCRLYRRRCAVC